MMSDPRINIGDLTCPICFNEHPTKVFDRDRTENAPWEYHGDEIWPHMMDSHLTARNVADAKVEFVSTVCSI